MKSTWTLSRVLALPVLAVACIGCHSPYGGQLVGPAPQPLGAEVDQINQTQEINAEAAKFVIYMHEFELNEWDPQGQVNVGGWRLNAYGEDHVKQIAVNLKRGFDFPVVVERSQTSVRPGTKFEYPVHFNDQLDAQRRRVVVSSLLALGVEDAEQRVIVAPAFSEGITGGEAARAYQRGLRGFGGYGGGGYGGGGFGGFGGGFR